GSPLVAGAVTMLYTMSPSSTTSLTPWTVTVCGRFQFALVNVRLTGLTVPSVGSLELRLITTFAVGRDASTTVNVGASPPISDVIRPEVGVMMIPAVSSSMLMTETSFGSVSSYFGSPLAAGAVTMV